MRVLPTVARFVCALALASASLGVQAAKAAPPANTESSGLTLSQAWRATLQNDPTYQAAISEREAGQTNRAIGRAGLLPQVSASLGRNKIRGTLDEPGPGGNTVGSDLNYPSRTNEIRATQTVFNWSRIAEYRQGQARADYSLAVFDTRAKDTSLRLINRYFQVLLSYENVSLAQSKLDANEKQITVAQRRYDGGEGTVTDVHEAKSRRDLARADLIKAEDALVVARRELQEMVGSAPLRISMLKRDFKPGVLIPATQEDWLVAAMAGNSEIRSGQEGVRISDQEVDRTFGGHLPTLDIVAARRVVSGETISTRDQDSSTNSFGIQVALPIFSGGLTSAQVGQARHNRDRASQELAATRERVAVEVTRQYQAVVSGAQRISALVTAVESSAEALRAIEMGYQAGTRSIVDILDAQDLLYQSRLDLTQARLQYVLARLSLAGAASTLDARAIDSASDAYFGPEQVILR
ncbi:channel protein TolC [Candidimonas sp. SYP-B2681]|uniref:TolC family outer membrane protein n=1 Tax=Candidimonas sp. SYP-B2681 TaxID=2497686 RepID=UPI000F88ACB0|nr:TolC family outer membrane protein [Candidimonas sp. SYP-B2681]RTZ43170.1 channel protein TolC [Candidimonas sp. SYP-B2681]